MKWLDEQRIQIKPPKNPKKLTGTRFATIFGLNPWSTDFEVWCDITHTYTKPFEDTKYTLAGKTIEPKQAQYMKDTYGMYDIVTPADLYGKDYFKQTRGNFFFDPIFGGMWDYLRQTDGKTTAVLEMKTTKRAEDWQDDIPEYYALQAALYAYLLGVDDIIMVASFLGEKDYDDPNAYKCTVNNTITRPFKVSERYPHFQRDYITPAIRWWSDHVVEGISPQYDERKDAEILKELRTHNLSPETDIADLVAEAEELKVKIDEYIQQTDAINKRYKELTDMIKTAAIEMFRDGDSKVSVSGKQYTFEVNKYTKNCINKDALEADGLLNMYTVQEETYKISIKKNKGDK